MFRKIRVKNIYKGAGLTVEVFFNLYSYFLN